MSTWTRSLAIAAGGSAALCAVGEVLSRAWLVDDVSWLIGQIVVLGLIALATAVFGIACLLRARRGAGDGWPASKVARMGGTAAALAALPVVVLVAGPSIGLDREPLEPIGGALSIWGLALFVLLLTPLPRAERRAARVAALRGPGEPA